MFRGTPRFRHVPVIVISAKDLSPEEQERIDRHTATVLRKGHALEAGLRLTLETVLTRNATAPAAIGAGSSAPAQAASGEGSEQNEEGTPA